MRRRDDPIAGLQETLALHAAIRTLPPREQRIVVLSFYGERSQRRVADDVGLSQIHVSRLLRGALAPVARRARGRRAGCPLRRGRVDSRRDAAAGNATRPEAANRRTRWCSAAPRTATARAWLATVEELPGCTAHGPTPEGAAAGARVAIEHWLREAAAEGREVPPPARPRAHSGKLLVRMPRSLHGELARASEREGTSLNAYIVAALAASVAWRAAGTGDAPDAGTPHARGLSVALTVNLAVLALVGVVAVALLIAAGRRSRRPPMRQNNGAPGSLPMRCDATPPDRAPRPAPRVAACRPPPRPRPTRRRRARSGTG